MNRVTHGARGDGQRAQTPPLPRRSPLAQTPGGTGQYRPKASVPRAVRAHEERYRPGARRTSAEPLTASWQPKQEDDEGARSRPRKKRGLGRLTKVYGWRVYALPVLVVLTALVVFQTATSSPETGDQQNAASAGAAGADGGPVATENPAQPVNLNIPTAELPAGADFTPKGAGTYRVLPVPPGLGKKVGKGTKRAYTYTIEVENGIDPASYAGDDAFARAVEGILANPKGWTGGNSGISLQWVDGSKPDPDFRVSLTTPETDHRPDVCDFQIKYEASCYRRSFENRVVINLARWVRGAAAFGSDLGLYRQYAINHEVGHALGNGHVGCGKDGDPAPVMMQQSFGVSNDYVAQLNQVDPTNYGKVAADGKVCKPNPFPNP
ncbi:DUF3152 domain-containing protein [Amycolatopsis anabasis]|uniref:DUF3152 domain-containing protein n=1 Tax=Amycolatopsis anabasis TaxID=1840409 RepID=UPI00131CEB21|nr:DUF3152 domain-containing protein [Amycolatopsis anabasis]